MRMLEIRGGHRENFFHTRQLAPTLADDAENEDDSNDSSGGKEAERRGSDGDIDEEWVKT